MRIQIIGRRWFQSSTGNTYHSATITVDDKSVEGIDYAYGHGGMYLQNAWAKLVHLGIVTDWQEREPIWQWAKRKNVTVDYHAVDVPRKKDL